jgi:hypothetical protein
MAQIDRVERASGGPSSSAGRRGRAGAGGSADDRGSALPPLGDGLDVPEFIPPG